MSKKCAKCDKTVYPTEELKCLDKTWHKGCFRCWECGMTLNMKNYKGYEKKPYCSAHYPTTRFTAVAETPEMARIAQNTKLQSQINYHSDFEKSRGHYTEVADNIELQRLKKNTQNASLINYHSDFEKKKGQYTSVADDPETKRLLKASQNASLLQYHSDHEKNKGHYTSVSDDPETRRLLENTKKSSLINYHSDFEKSKGRKTSIADDMETQRIMAQSENVSMVKYHQEYEKLKGKKITVTDDPELLRVKQQQQIVSNVSYHGIRENKMDQEHRRENIGKDGLPMTQRQPPGSMPSYNPPPQAYSAQEAPPASQFNSPYSAKNQGNTVYTSQGQGQGQSQGPGPAGDGGQADGRRRVGSIADYDPMNEHYGSITGQYPMPNTNSASNHSQQQWVEDVPSPRHSRAYMYNASPAYQVYNANPAAYQAYNAYPAYNSVSRQYQSYYPAQQQQQQQQHHQPPQQQQHYEPQRPPPVERNPMQGCMFQAMYDYDAKDSDEVSFAEGDIIVNPEPIDEGWMYGTVKRSGETGMLPANYVQQI